MRRGCTRCHPGAFALLLGVLMLGPPGLGIPETGAHLAVLRPDHVPPILASPAAAARESAGGFFPGPALPLPGHGPATGPAYRMTTVSREGTNPCAYSYFPGWVGFDSGNRTLWVAGGTDCMDVYDANLSLLEVLPVGYDPYAVAFDDARHEAFVTNWGSSNVTVFNTTSYGLLANITVGAQPVGVAVDPVSGETFVANSGAGDVSVISDARLSVTATIGVGVGPGGVAYDPASGEIFVANNGSDNASVIDPATLSVVASYATGSTPLGVVAAGDTGRVFVTNSGSNNVTVINAIGGYVEATIPVIGPGLTLQQAAYDPASDQVWVAAGWGWVVVLNASTLQVVGYLGSDPSGVAYDSATGAMCVVGAGNMSFACLTRAYPANTYSPLTFAERGLPRGTLWSVDVGYGAQTSRTRNDTFGVLPPVYCCSGWPTVDYTIPAAGGFVATPSNGSVNVCCPQAVVNVTFHRALDRYPVTFSEMGLPAGTVWSVTFNGTTNHSAGSSDVFWVRNGTDLPYQVGPVAGYVPIPGSGSVNVTGMPLGVFVHFGQPPEYPLRFTQTGLPNGSAWYVRVAGTWYSSTNATLPLLRPNGSYPFLVGDTGAYRPTPGNGTAQVRGAATNVSLTFKAGSSGPPTYPVVFTESGLAAGAVWAVTVNRTIGFGGNTTTLTTSLPNGTYPFAVTAGAGYAAHPPSGLVQVAGGPASTSVVFDVLRAPLEVGFTSQLLAAPCSTGPTTNEVLLEANVSGGEAPYRFRWPTPSGMGNASWAVATLTQGQNTTVSLSVTDTSGDVRVDTRNLSLQIPSCPPPVSPGTSSPGTRASGSDLLGVPVWALGAAIGAAIGVGAGILGTRPRRPTRPG